MASNYGCYPSFRNDYLDTYKNLTPTFHELIGGGGAIRAEKGVISVFPSNTFPNHYSMVTGLYPESHGIVDNHFYDPQTDTHFDISRNEFIYYRHGVPIWITAEDQVI